MSYFKSMDISASALTAQRFRMDVIAENVANSLTTRTADGTPYRRRFTVFQERDSMPPFSSVLKAQTTKRSEMAADWNTYRKVTPYEKENFAFYLSNTLQGMKATALGDGVRVVSVHEDPSPMKFKYDPAHPDADEEGYIQLPNIDVVTEMVDMMSSVRSYEANVTALNAFKDMAARALQIGK